MLSGILKGGSIKLFWGRVGGALLISGVGVFALAFFPIGRPLGGLSYDIGFLPRLFRTHISDEAVMVYLDQKIQIDLGVSADKVLDRKYHAELLRKLKLGDARLVLFDFLFVNPSDDSSSDLQFRQAIKDNGKVVLVGYADKVVQGNAGEQAILPPLPALREVACGWGLANISPEPDGVFRRLDQGVESWPSASWTAASFLGASITRDSGNRFRDCWLNYYGPLSSFSAINFDQAIATDRLKSGLFRNKIVVVGARPSVPRVAGDPPEMFRVPFGRFGGSFASGAQIHALSLLNLLHGDWIKRLSFGCEISLIIVWGALLGAGLCFLRPWPAVLTGIALMLVIAASGTYVQLRHNIWWSWMIPAAVQTPLAMIWSVGYQYATETRRKKMLRQAFANYLSPHLADQIAEGDFDLSLGGNEVEATVMFTDLAGFTAMSETLRPREVSTILTTYFNQTTRAILEQGGTIIKYMGDSVEAVWGAPLADARQAERAVLAAWGMTQAGRKEIAGQVLKTRIGINSGPALAGNLGSEFRFDYAVIGDTTNLASRLETLNKYLGTDILISDTTRRGLTNMILTRPLGRFLLAGKRQPVAVHEIVGVGATSAEVLPWLAVFEQALQSFTDGDLGRAESLFSQIIALRGGQDGPSQFYLQQIGDLRVNKPLTDQWDGVIVLKSK